MSVISTKLLSAAAGSAGGAGLDVAEVFSTYLYEGTGTNAAQTFITVNNGIDLSGEGGLVWVKARTNPGTNSNNSYYSSGAGAHMITDSENGLTKQLSANNTTAGINFGAAGPVFNNSGFVIGYNGYTDYNYDGYKYTSFSFRQAENFFDIVTYTGTGSYQGSIAHNLGSSPGMIVVKRTDSSGNWVVWHRSSNPKNLQLNSSSAATTEYAIQDVTSTSFGVTNYTTLKASESGATYVAYLFAHNDGDGEFGPDGNADIIKCGSASATGLTTVNLGFEPQFVLIKSSSISNSWNIFDSMRGLTADSGPQILHPNLTDVEYTGSTDTCNLTSTGFTFNSSRFNGNGDYIYMAIRAPMIKEPEAATDVFAIYNNSSNTTEPVFRTSPAFPVDYAWFRDAPGGTDTIKQAARLTGPVYLNSTSTAAEASLATAEFDYMNGWRSTGGSGQYSWMWKRAKGYFDVVAYSGNSSYPRNISHSLGVVPEMMWVKTRNAADNWRVYSKDMTVQQEMLLNGTYAASSTGSWGTGGRPTDSVFITGSANTNYSGRDYIAYLFATLAGISKVGSYTGTGSLNNIDCGFTSGARFVIIKKTTSAGEWFVFDTTRGITTASTDGVLQLQSTSQQYTEQVFSNQDMIRPYSSGFAMATGSSNQANENSQTYIFYAIA
tara:strand:- start:721 stop:2709 length:1989 start_codon:yes stop_codon:yes gene_type:complete